MLTSSPQIYYGRYHDLVDSYEISISQMTMNMTFYVDVYLLTSMTAKTITELGCIYHLYSQLFVRGCVFICVISICQRIVV